ncbi:MAG: cryptochrome/photolyase family protein [Gammaproteobacteria bacterium]|nr:cryptochrome/photolyase family protein [Gammaproteobacteria bacterium]
MIGSHPGILRIILLDQLSSNISSLRNFDPASDCILMFETLEDCTYVKHHKKKLVLILSAMRHFAQELRDKRYPLEYIYLDDAENSGSLIGEITRFVKKRSFSKIIITWPGEYRVLEKLRLLQKKIKIPLEILEDDRFLASRDMFAEWAKNHKTLRMEFFYRVLRQKYQILMKDNQPEGGQWNYDAENRKFPTKKLNVPKPYQITIDSITQEVIDTVSQKFADHFGDVLPFHFAVTRQDALEILDDFIRARLPHFGDYQDAMIQDEPWMYHSHISFYINLGLLEPLECINAAQNAYYKNKASLNSVEGFIRQILGWREYVRGLYWLKMPEYKKLNYFDASRKLPWFYWDANTNMNCINQCVSQTKQHAYAHHIQRLMVLGNFALLTGIHPDEVNEWYLIVYADAYEWVELPNVTGMILFADGGYLGSKPYAASGAYINKMSNYCQNCHYDVKQKTGEKACPFNYLYWNFLEEHKDRLQKNPRLKMIYSTLERMDKNKKNEIRSDSKNFLSTLE